MPSASRPERTERNNPMTGGGAASVPGQHGDCRPWWLFVEVARQRTRQHLATRTTTASSNIAVSMSAWEQIKPPIRRLERA
jgi:hypothetical protein